MDQKYLAFDIEIAKEIPDGGGPTGRAHRPLGSQLCGDARQ